VEATLATLKASLQQRDLSHKKRRKRKMATYKELTSSNSASSLPDLPAAVATEIDVDRVSLATTMTAISTTAVADSAEDQLDAIHTLALEEVTVPSAHSVSPSSYAPREAAAMPVRGGQHHGSRSKHKYVEDDGGGGCLNVLKHLRHGRREDKSGGGHRGGGGRAPRLPPVPPGSRGSSGSGSFILPKGADPNIIISGI